MAFARMSSLVASMPCVYPTSVDSTSRVHAWNGKRKSQLLELAVLRVLKANAESPEESYAHLPAWWLWGCKADTHNVRVHSHTLSWKDSRIYSFRRVSGPKCNCSF